MRSRRARSSPRSFAAGWPAPAPRIPRATGGARAGGGEPKHEVELLRQFQRAAVFRVAVADLSGRLPIMKVSDRLTDIAELIVQEALDLAWVQITARHGRPERSGEAGPLPAGLIVVAYGKFGGYELG